MTIYRSAAYAIWGLGGLSGLILLASEAPGLGVAVAFSASVSGIVFLALDEIIATLKRIADPHQVQTQALFEVPHAADPEAVRSTRSAEEIAADLELLRKRVS